MATVDALLDKVNEIALLIRAHAEAAEQTRRLTQPVVTAMQQAGLYRLARSAYFKLWKPYRQPR